MTESLRFLTWNLKYGGRRKTVPKADLLERFEWDIAALQEISPSSWETLTDRGLTSGAVCALEQPDPPTGRRRHGAALLVRNGVVLEAAAAIGGPKPGRGVGAVARRGALDVAVASWHAPNAAGQGPAAKMLGYEGFLAWVGAQTRTIVTGFDSNHWARSTALDLPDVPSDPNDRWLLEHQFFGAHPPHELRDVFLDILRADPARYARAVQERPDGPLAVSYRRGSTAKPKDDRFDYIFVSEDVRCVDADYHFEEGCAAGSDHAPVSATLTIDAGVRT